MNMNIMKKSAASLAIAGIGMIGVIGGAGMATAQEVTPGTPDVTTIGAPQSDTFSLTINKYLGDAFGEPNVGGGTVTIPEGADVTPLPGVEFTLTPLNGIDLTTIDGWQTYQSVVGDNPNALPETLPTGVTLGTPIVVTTDANGQIVLDQDTTGFAMGAYFVQETGAPADTNIAPALPFYVSVPMTNAEGNAWNYDVNVYPKNQELNISKTVTDQGVNQGGQLTYAITTSVPDVPATGAFDGYDIIDRHHESITPILNEGLVVDFVTGEGATVQQTLEAADYTVSAGTAENPEANEFTVSLTRTGLDKLAEARGTNSDLEVRLTFNADLDNTAPGQFDNDPFLIPPNTANPNPTEGRDVPPPEVPGNEVLTIEGQISIEKVSNTDQTPLADAVFELHKCEPGTTNLQGDNSLVSWPGLTDDAGNAQGTQFTTDSNGTVTLPTVQVEDYYNGAPGEDTFDYCLVEVQAPEGYELQPDPISVSLTSSTEGLARIATVTNVPSNGGGDLPMTGAAGITGLILLGAGIAGVSALTRKKEDEDES